MKTFGKFFLVILVIVFTNNFAQSQWIHSDTLCKGSVNDLLTSNGYIFACTGDGIYRSSNNGIVWSKSDTGLTSKEVLSMGFVVNKLFAGTFTGGIFYSTNNGNEWHDASGGLSITNVNGFIEYPIKSTGDTSVIACFHDTLFNGSVYSTNDAGAHWIPISTGITNPDVRAIVAHDTNIFVGTMGGVFYSSNGGLVWESRNDGLNVPYVVTLLSHEKNLFAGTITGGAYRSTNDGANWEKINTGLTNTYVNAFVMSVDGKLFTGTGWSGVFFSMDNGSHWTQINTGLTTYQINTLAVDPDGKYIYAGTDDGVWYRPTSEITSTQQEKEDGILGRIYLCQNYPNPFNPSTTIRYSVATNTRWSNTGNGWASVPTLVTLKIYDMLGREIATLVNEEQSAGWKEVEWNASAFSSGIYFYKLQAGNFVNINKMIFMK